MQTVLLIISIVLLLTALRLLRRRPKASAKPGLIKAIRALQRELEREV